MTRKPKGNIDKLPKWAQNYISVLESDIQYYQSQIAEFGSGKSNIEAEINLDNSINLPDRTHIKFMLDRAKNSWIIVSMREGAVHVTGCRAVRTIHRVANWFSVEIDEKRG